MFLEIRSDNAAPRLTAEPFSAAGRAISSASPGFVSPINRPFPAVPLKELQQRDLFFSDKSFRARVDQYLQAKLSQPPGKPVVLAFTFQSRHALDADCYVLAFWDNLARLNAESDPDTALTDEAVAEYRLNSCISDDQNNQNQQNHDNQQQDDQGDLKEEDSTLPYSEPGFCDSHSGEVANPVLRRASRKIQEQKRQASAFLIDPDLEDLAILFPDETPLNDIPDDPREVPFTQKFLNPAASPVPNAASGPDSTAVVSDADLYHTETLATDLLDVHADDFLIGDQGVMSVKANPFEARRNPSEDAASARTTDKMTAASELRKTVFKEPPRQAVTEANKVSAGTSAKCLAHLEIRWLAVNTGVKIPLPLQVMATADERLSEKNIAEAGLKQLRYAYDPLNQECYPEEIFANRGIQSEENLQWSGVLKLARHLLPQKNPLRLAIDEEGTIWLGTRYKWQLGQVYRDQDGRALKIFDLVRLPDGRLGVIQQETLLQTMPFVSYSNPFSKKVLKDAMIAAVEGREESGYTLAG